MCDDELITAVFSRSVESRLQPRHLTLVDEGSGECSYTTDIDNDFVYISIPFVGCGTKKTVCTDMAPITLEDGVKKTAFVQCHIIMIIMIMVDAQSQNGAE